MIRLSISNLLCGRNAAPPTIANWHAKACGHADEGTQASLPATRLEDAPCKWGKCWLAFIILWFVMIQTAMRSLYSWNSRDSCSQEINRLLTQSNLNFFSSWVEQPNDRFGLKVQRKKRTVKNFLVTFIDFGNYMVAKMLPNAPFYLLKIMMIKRE